MKIDYYSNVNEAGELQKNIRQLIANDLQHFRGKRVHITIDRIRSIRSLQQNRLWWLYMGILSKELGYTKDEIHEIAKFKFLQREKADEKTGEVFTFLGSTAKLNKTDFAELVDRIIQWSAETFGIVLPLPGDQTDIDFNPERTE